MAAPRYGTAHQAERERWRPTVEAGEAYCAEPDCLMPDRWIEPGTPWDLAHDTPSTYRGPAHALCNRAEGGRRGHAASCRNPTHHHTVTTWTL